MTVMWEKLIVILNQTLQIYQALLQISRQKRETLIAADPQTLDQLTKQEEMLIIEAGKLEKQRQPIMQELAAALGITLNDVTLSTLVQYADDETAAELEEISEEFLDITAELTQLNELNEKLIKQSLEYINYNINVLSQTAAESTYAPQGQDGPGKIGRFILDKKV
ncbi:MAG: FlgN protein [Firmicutes bacterium]|nr:FlgN protein [Bacillota bacterium]